jgi:hypothetical protein
VSDECTLLTELRGYACWTPELGDLAVRAASISRFVEAHQAALAAWFTASERSSQSSMTAIVIDDTGTWRNDEAFARLLRMELERVLRSAD